jgi:uncharacterized protein
MHYLSGLPVLPHIIDRVSVPHIQMRENEALLALKVQPRASRNGVGDVLGKELKVQITAPPVDSAANEALLDFLSERLQCRRSCLRLEKGAASRHKIVSIQGMTEEEIARRLQP